MAGSEQARARTGIKGLDEILLGGLPAGRAYLLAGDPGAGKTTLALQFLLEGRRCGERCLYVTLSESAEELRSIADSHGFDVEGIEILDIQALMGEGGQESRYTIFHPSEVELGELTRIVLERIDSLQPARVCFDSLSEVRLLARDSLRLRREVLAMKRALAGRECTSLFIDYRAASGEFELESLVHGVIEIAQETLEFGGERRRLVVRKIRGSSFVAGMHDYRIGRGGLDVFPRLVAAESRGERLLQPYASGIEQLDAMLGGGLATGTSTLLLGPSGVGKSTLASAWALAAARRDEPALVYLFDESAATWRARIRALGLAPEGLLGHEQIRLVEVDPAELGPNEFAQMVVRQAGETGARVVIIDTVNGYLSAMPATHHLVLHLHELLSILAHRDLVTVLVMTQHGFVGQGIRSPIDLSFIADAVVLLRFFETAGEIRKAVAALKKRYGSHERTIRELVLSTERGIEVGEPLERFQGVLSGHLAFAVGQPPAGTEWQGGASDA